MSSWLGSRRPFDFASGFTQGDRGSHTHPFNALPEFSIYTHQPLTNLYIIIHSRRSRRLGKLPCPREALAKTEAMGECLPFRRQGSKGTLAQFHPMLFCVQKHWCCPHRAKITLNKLIKLTISK